MQTISENEENSFSKDFNRSITKNKMYKLDYERSSFTELNSHMTMFDRNDTNTDITNGKTNDLFSDFLLNCKAPKLIKDLNSEYKSNEPFCIRLIVQGDSLNIEWFHDEKKVEPLANQFEFIQLDSYETYELVFNFRFSIN